MTVFYPSCWCCSNMKRYAHARTHFSHKFAKLRSGQVPKKKKKKTPRERRCQHISKAQRKRAKESGKAEEFKLSIDWPILQRGTRLRRAKPCVFSVTLGKNPPKPARVCMCVNKHIYTHITGYLPL